MRENHLTGVMTEVRRRERSDLDNAETGNGRRDTPINVAMVLVTRVTPIATKTTRATIFEPMERN
jgi:hypothetical protein